MHACDVRWQTWKRRCNHQNHLGPPIAAGKHRPGTLIICSLTFNVIVSGVEGHALYAYVAGLCSLIS